MEQETKQEIKQYHVRRIGSVTFGITLLCFGILFLIHTFEPMLKYQYIFRFWPIVFILLGCEVLAENHRSKAQNCMIIYDFAAILMMGIMMLFAMIMALIDFEIACGPYVLW